MKQNVDIIIDNVSELVTVAGARLKPKTGPRLNELSIIKDGAVAITGTSITAVGTSIEINSNYTTGEVISAENKTVLPGLVDSHTHLVFAPLKHSGYEAKIAGESYSGIHRKGGGINHAVECTRAASPDELTSKALKDLGVCMLHGTTTLEAKSGYGLDRENELKILRCVSELKQSQPINIVATFLGAHTVPKEYEHNRGEYIKLVSSLLEDIRTEGLAEYCDVFCDKLGFSVDESRSILQAALLQGFGLKIHAEQSEYYGGAELAAELGATSADHLDHICNPRVTQSGYELTTQHLELLARAGTIGTLLPGATYHSMDMTPGSNSYRGFLPETVRRLIDGGVAIALATNYNPSSSRTRSMQSVMEVAARLYRLSYAEIINASTINAAHALGRGNMIGSIEPDKQADIVIFDCGQHGTIIEDFGINLVDKVIIGGKLVVDNQKLI